MSDPKWVSILKPYDFEAVNRFTIADFQYISTYAGGSYYPYGSTLGTRRQGLVNWLPVKSGDGYYLTTRNGLTSVTSVFGKGVATYDKPRGIFWLNTINKLVEIWGTTVYVHTGVDTYQTLTSVGAATEGPGGVTEGVDSSGAAYGFVSTVSKSAVIAAAGTMTAISDGDFPASVVPTPVFLDSYIFVAQLSTRKIFNSAVGDPTSWAASTFIQTEDYGGNIVALARQKGKLVAFCENHIEFFRDAAVPAPNSPLLREQDLTIKIGCINRATIAQLGDVIYFAGQDAKGQRGIYRLEDFKATKVSSASIDWLVTSWGGSGGVFGNITTWTHAGLASSNNTPSQLFATGYMMQMHGKWYYALIFGCGAAQYATNVLYAYPSFLYDPELGLWVEIAASHYHASGTLPQVSAGWPFPFGCIQHSTATGASSYKFLLQLTYGGSDDDHLAALTHSISTGEVVDIQNGGFETGVNPWTHTVVHTPVTDFGSPARKIISGFESSHTRLASSVTNIWAQSGSANAYLSISAEPEAKAYTTKALEYSLVTYAYTPPDGDHTQRLVTPLFRGSKASILYQTPISASLGQLYDLKVRIHSLEGPG